MENTKRQNGQYKRLDLSKIPFSDTPVSYDEVMRGVRPIKFDDDVLSGKRKITVTKAEKDIENKCVKLEIFC